MKWAWLGLVVRYIWSVTPEAALNKQIEGYRKMTGEQRLKIALDLHDFACEVARAGIRHQYPKATEHEVKEFLRRRLRLAYSS